MRFTRKEHAERLQQKLKNPREYQLTKMQKLLIEAYCDKDNKDTFLNKKASMEAAGYKHVTTRSINDLFKKPHIKHAMDVFTNNKCMGFAPTKQDVLDMFKKQYDKADLNGDVANCLRTVEGLARTLGMFNDRMIVSTEQQQRIDESMESEARALAHARMAEILEEGVAVGAAMIKVEDAPEEMTPLNDDTPPPDEIMRVL